MMGSIWRWQCAVCAVTVMCMIVMITLNRHVTVTPPHCWHVLSSDAGAADVMRMCGASLREHVARQLDKTKLRHSPANHSRVNHSQENYSKENHSQENHSQENHSQENHSQEKHSQSNHSQENHSQENHSQENHSQENHSQENHPPSPRPTRRRETGYRAFRDVSSDVEDSQMEECNFPAIIASISGSPPRLVSRVTARSCSTTADYKNTSVPNIVHYVWYGPPLQMTFLNFLSVLSVHKFIKPLYIFIHGDNAPTGQWWDKTIGSIPNIHVVDRPKPVTINGKVPRYPQHYADVARLEILLDYGGIYFDWDALAVRSFEPLLQYDVTLGREIPTSLSNGIILAKRSAAFLRIWLETYHTFQINEWSKHSCAIPHKLLQLFPHLIHVEETSIVRPNMRELDQLFRGHYPWRNNYAIHVWKKHGPVPRNSAELKTVNSTLGDVMRHILYDD